MHQKVSWDRSTILCHQFVERITLRNCPLHKKNPSSTCNTENREELGNKATITNCLEQLMHHSWTTSLTSDKEEWALNENHSWQYTLCKVRLT